MPYSVKSSWRFFNETFPLKPLLISFNPKSSPIPFLSIEIILFILKRQSPWKVKTEALYSEQSSETCLEMTQWHVANPFISIKKFKGQTFVLEIYSVKETLRFRKCLNQLKSLQMLAISSSPDLFVKINSYHCKNKM